MAFLLVFGVVSAQSSKKRIGLTDLVEKDLISVLEASETLRASMYAKQEALVISNIEQVRAQIRHAKQNLKSEGRNAQHLDRILTTIDQDLSRARSTQREQKVKYIQEAFRQIVMLYQSYNISASFKVFFCKKDRSVWIQKDRKPQNPFESDSNCARLIN
jgi:hypothetical protein